jgi:hypothetical protein
VQPLFMSNSVPFLRTVQGLRHFGHEIEHHVHPEAKCRVTRTDCTDGGDA